MFPELETIGIVCPKNKRTEDIYSVQEDGTIVTNNYFSVKFYKRLSITFVSLRMFGI